MALVAFDFDGTLSRMDLFQLLGREYDVAGESRGLVEQGLRGDLAVADVMRQRAALFEGMPERGAESAYRRGRLRDGAAALIADLRRADVPVAIITASFERGVEVILDRSDVAVDHLVANHLEVRNEALTGDIDGPLMDAGKDAALQELAAAEGVPLGKTIAVGNGLSDLPMLQVAGTAIGFDPDSTVADHCDTTVTSMRKLRLHFEQHGITD